MNGFPGFLMAACFPKTGSRLRKIPMINKTELNII